MIPLFKVEMPPAELLMPALQDVLYNKPINEGECVYAFERELTKIIGAQNLITVNSGTSALHIALLLSGVTSGDEVLTTSMTAEPTNTVIKQIGATPIYIDLDSNGQLVLEDLEAKITEKTRAIIVVHYGGYPQYMEDIVRIGKERDFKVIEDCAHALLSKLGSINVGLLSDFGCFSFQAIKQLTTIEGGALAIKDPNLVSRAREMRWFGLSKTKTRQENNITTQGFKYNYNNVHATIGLMQVGTIENKIERSRYLAATYDFCIDSLKCIDRIIPLENSSPSYWLYTIQTDFADLVIKFLEERGIQAGKIHKPSHTHKYLSSTHHLAGTERFYRRLLHIPIGSWLADEEVKYILDSLRAADEFINHEII